jgi:hypothetical protein
MRSKISIVLAAQKDWGNWLKTPFLTVITRTPGVVIEGSVESPA